MTDTKHGGGKILRWAIIVAVFGMMLQNDAAVLAQPWQGQRAGGARGGQHRQPDTLSVGAVAPDFRLRTKDGRREVRLSDFRGSRPVVLIFGSYT